jgi:hypothetical protein
MFRKAMVILNQYFKKQKVFLGVLQCIGIGVLLQVVRKHKRSKAFLALFFPVTIAIFLIGWSLSWIGTQKQPHKTHVELPKDNVHLEAITLEEQTEIPN